MRYHLSGNYEEEEYLPNCGAVGPDEHLGRIPDVPESLRGEGWRTRKDINCPKCLEHIAYMRESTAAASVVKLPAPKKPFQPVLEVGRWDWPVTK